MQNKPCVITAEQHEHYLYVHVKSETTSRQKALDWLAEVSLLSAQYRSRRILLDRDIPEFIMCEDIAEAIDAVADTSLGVRLAIVNRVSTLGPAMRSALQRLGKDKPNVQFFDDLRTAKKWLAN